ncbi:MAG TPA: lipase family protein, partial [Bacteroidales bacterium]|nr:lipase family protein [Bacteroidales bacterium]
GCSKDKGDQPAENKYLQTFEKVDSYSAGFIKAILGTQSNNHPAVNSIITSTVYGIDIYKIAYKTTFKGSDVTASGLVCVPAAGGEFPIISFQNGTNTSHYKAPSVNPNELMYSLMEAMAGNGYIVVIADYLGFGASQSMIHPYYDKESTSQSVVDMILATHELLNDDQVEAKSSGKHFLMGYSQGGWATLATLKMCEQSYNSEIPVAAASCGAGAYDLMTMSDYVLAQQTFPGPLYLPYFIYSKINAGYITGGLTQYFKEPYASRIPGLFDGTHSNDEVNAQLNDTIEKLVTNELKNNLNTSADFASLRSQLAANSAGSWSCNAIIRFYHGTSDLNVPPEQSDIIYTSFINTGASSQKVSLMPLEGLTHETGLIPWGIETINWFNQIK